MYNAYELIELQIKPRINDFELDTLREFYEIFLNPFIYQYTLVDLEGKRRTIELRFDYKNFCHLLGIESIVKQAVSFKNLYQYRGINGWDNIKNKVITIPILKNINRRKFNNVKAKYVYFYLLPCLISKPLAIKYDKDMVVAYTAIECEILFYSQIEGDNAVIHLGLEKKADDSYYIARTFFVEKVNKVEDDIYVNKQEIIDVVVKQRIILG